MRRKGIQVRKHFRLNPNLQRHGPRCAKVNLVLHTAASADVVVVVVRGIHGEAVDEDKVPTGPPGRVGKEVEKVEAIGAHRGPGGLRKGITGQPAGKEVLSRGGRGV